MITKKQKQRMHLLNERERTIYNLRVEEGLKFREIGERLGITLETARLNYLNADRTLNKPRWTDGLSRRVATRLWRRGINSRKKLVEEFQSGRLHPERPNASTQYDRTDHKEVSEWLGLPMVPPIPLWSDGLSKRLIYCLELIGINSREEALRWYQSGMLFPGYPRVPYNRKSHKELADWLGVPATEKAVWMGVTEDGDPDFSKLVDRHLPDDDDEVD